MASGVLSMILPVKGRRAGNDIRIRQGCGVAVGREILASFEEQNAALRVSAQPRCKN
jgi:hypothetical protein